ncbi:hypothetical protein HGA91_00085 [candidate division WWE3 bacterium]|nr:hypothetical protein [candidate division WWE3 bacterium]
MPDLREIRNAAHEAAPFDSEAIGMEETFGLYPRVYGDPDSDLLGGMNATLSEAIALIRSYDGSGTFRMTFHFIAFGFVLRVTREGWVELDVRVNSPDSSVTIPLFHVGRGFPLDTIHMDDRHLVGLKLLWTPSQGLLLIRPFADADEQVMTSLIFVGQV